MKTIIKRINPRTYHWEITENNGLHLRGGYATTRTAAVNDCSITLACLTPDPSAIHALVHAARKALHIAPIYSGGRPDVSRDLRQALHPFAALPSQGQLHNHYPTLTQG